MKKLTFILATILLPTMILGQFGLPGCTYLAVENIQVDDDTTNLIKITISNSCSTCLSGLNGCVYEELLVIRTVSPFDTIAASNCFCLWSPDNNSQTIYSINSIGTSIPPLSEIRVSLMPCDCDTIPFSQTLGIISNEISNSIQIFPNPANDLIIINTTMTSNLTVRIIDLMGHVGTIKKVQMVNDEINISHLAKGFYIIEILDDNKRTIKTSKITKE